MNRTTGICLVWVAMIAAPARAADEDTQLWVTQSASVPLAEGIDGTLDVSERYRETGVQLLTRASADFRLSEVAVVGGGAAHVITEGGAEEFRPHQQLTLTFGPLALRSRVEERFFDGADRMELRLRQRATLTQPLSKSLKAALAGELLYLARTRNAGDGDRIDQWRANATLTQRLSPGLEGTVGYLMIFQPLDGGPDKLSHVAQVSISYKG